MEGYFEKKDKQKDRDTRPSWRDVDAKKDGRSPDQEHKPAFRNHADLRKESEAKKALHDLFAPKKKSKEQIDAWKKLNAATGKGFVQKVTEYVDKYGLPKEWDDLLRLLDHPDPDFLQQIVEQLEKQSPDQSTSKLELCIGKLRVTKLTTEDPDVVANMDRLIAAFEQKI